MDENDLTPEQIEYSLLKCMIGSISTLDIWRNRLLWQISDSKADEILYKKSIDDHCAMKMHQTDEIH